MKTELLNFTVATALLSCSFHQPVGRELLGGLATSNQLGIRTPMDLGVLHREIVASQRTAVWSAKLA